jgi:hypothetical protein
MIRLLLLALLAQVPAPTGSISGRVLDMETNAPLAGVNVGSQTIGRVRTDAEGRYVLRNVAAGAAVTVFVQEANGGYTNMTLTSPKRVAVAAGRETTNVDFRVRLDAQISGRVLDENGEPLPGIRVSVVERVYVSNDDNTYSNGSIAPRLSFGVVTDDRGAYRIDNNVFAGRHYYVLAQQPKRYANPVSDVPSDSQSRRRSLVPTFYPSASSLETAVPIVPKSLEHRSDLEIRMRRAPNYCLDGVLNAGATPAQLRFAIQDENVPGESPQGNGVPALGGESGPDGRIRVCDLYPGRFVIIAAQAAPNTALTQLSGALPVTITNADVTGLKVAAMPPVMVAGEVAWDNPPADASFKPVLDIRHSPRPLSAPRPAGTSVPGEFSFTALPTLEYSLAIFAQAPPGTPSAMPASMYVKDITYGGTSVLHGAINPGDGSSKLRIVVGDDAGSIGVNVQGSDGKPSAGTAVIILPASAQTVTELAATLRVGNSDDGGAYTLVNVPPGRYYVLATNDPPPSQSLTPSGRLVIVKTPENLGMLLRVRGSGQMVEVGPRAAVQVRVTPRALE